MSSNEKYFTNLTIIWIAPNINNWDIEFVYLKYYYFIKTFKYKIRIFFKKSATVVQNYTTYWNGIKSKPIKAIYHLTSIKNESFILKIEFKIISIIIIIAFLKN